jgi:tRNA G18 (ribose-2'-O)-methylase SpoU
MLIPIDDPADPRIEPYRAVRERDLAGRDGCFVAEGEVVLRVLVRGSPDRILSILTAENRLSDIRDVVKELPPDVPVYVASRSVMDAVVGFPIHRGLLALGRRPPLRPAEEALAALPDCALVVGLVGLTNHDNVGGVFRNAAAFGAKLVLIDRETCDPLYRKAIRVSVGASLIVPFVRVGSGASLVDALGRHGFEALALSPGGSEPLSAVRPGRRTAILLGAEGPGLPPDILARARAVAIPMAGGFDSLNVATTSGIVLHHLTTTRPPEVPASFS